MIEIKEFIGSLGVLTKSKKNNKKNTLKNDNIQPEKNAEEKKKK